MKELGIGIAAAVGGYLVISLIKPKIEQFRLQQQVNAEFEKSGINAALEPYYGLQNFY